MADYKGTYKPKKTFPKKDSRKDGETEQRTFEGTLKTLMTEEEKKEAQILDLSYDFSCRIIRLYKFLNEGKLSKADRKVVNAGKMKAERVKLFEKLQELCEKYKRVNQYV